MVAKVIIKKKKVLGYPDFTILLSTIHFGTNPSRGGIPANEKRKIKVENVLFINITLFLFSLAIKMIKNAVIKE